MAHRGSVMIRYLETRQRTACMDRAIALLAQVHGEAHGARIVGSALALAAEASDPDGTFRELLDWLMSLYDGTEDRQCIALAAAQVAIYRRDMGVLDGATRAVEHVDWLVSLSEDELERAISAARAVVLYQRGSSRSLGETAEVI